MATVLDEVSQASTQVARETASRPGKRSRMSGWHFVLFPIAILFLVPFLQMALASFSPAKELVAFPPPFIPSHFTLDGSGPSFLETPDLSQWPQVHWTPDAAARRVDLDHLTPEEVQSWKAGDRLLLNGAMLTGRDAAHKRIKDMLSKGDELPVSFKGRAIYYVGPVDPVMGEVVGPAGPTTATRMDKFTDTMLELGLLAMIGKAERGQGAVAEIARHKVAYLMAVGGAAYLVARAIREAKVVAFEDLGMEAIYEFRVQDMPVTVAVDSSGANVHRLAPAEWKAKIAAEHLLPTA